MDTGTVLDELIQRDEEKSATQTVREQDGQGDTDSIRQTGRETVRDRC